MADLTPTPVDQACKEWVFHPHHKAEVMVPSYRIRFRVQLCTTLVTFAVVLAVISSLLHLNVTEG